MSTNPLIVPLAKQIAAVLTTKATSGTPFSMALTAVFSYVPQYDPADLTTLTVTVVAKAKERALASRTALDQVFHVDLGIQKKLTGADGENDALMAVVDELDDYLRQQDVSDAGLVWIGSSNDPIYSADHMRKGIFTSVLTLSYRVVGGGG